LALPTQGSVWPPKELRTVFDSFNIWSAWYANDPATLGIAYQTQTRAPYFRQGFLNRLADWFWTPKESDGDAGVMKLHVPIASDLCQVSADLLFSEPPKFTVDDPKGKNAKAQERIDLITGARLDQTLVAAAEVSAALGGVYLRATWDDTLYDHVFITKVDADGAIPTFRYGKLVAVTFWQVVGLDGSRYWRHLECHSLDSFGVGVIEHGLFEGSVTDIGVRIPLDDHEATKHLAVMVDADSQISTRTPGLAVEYAPNVTPNRRWRLDPAGANLGRSDLDGIEPLMDAMDRVYSSLMRDIELGKARLIVPQAMLTDLGPGKGATFDTDKALFTGINAAPGSAADSKLSIEQVQFAIRVQDHLDAAAALFEQIIRTAGYSSQTFGEKDNGRGEQTATEVTAKERRSYLTRDRKIRAISPALEGIIFKAVAMDAVLFNSGATAVPVKVSFADAVQDSLTSLAQTAQLLKAAEAASRATLVQIVHPDWDQEQIDAEVARIVAEQPTFPDPFMHPSDGNLTDGGNTADPTGDPAVNG
jgi:A118 family predicted phage portal protein